MNKSLISLLFALLLWNCSGERGNDNFALEREISSLRVEIEGGELVLNWDEPLAMLSEPDNFQGYTLWAVLDEEAEQGFIEAGIPSSSDFTSYNENSYSQNILKFDLNLGQDDLPTWAIPDSLLDRARNDNKTTVVFLIWADFGSDFRASRTSARVFLKDVFPADKVDMTVDFGPDYVKVRWVRPADVVSRVPSVEDGKIFGYNLALSYVEGAGTSFSLDNTQLLDDSTFIPSEASILPNQVILTENQQTPLVNVDSTFKDTSNTGANRGTLNYAILDGGKLGQADSVFELYFSGLEYETSYTLTALSFDSLGNTFDLQSEAFVSPSVLTFKTTDSVAPVFNSNEILVPVESDPSRKVIYWEKATDDSGIEAYSILKIDSSARGLDSNIFEFIPSRLADTLIEFGSLELDMFYDTLNYFIPGSVVRLELRARDSSGFASLANIVLDTIAYTRPELCPDSTMIALSNLDEVFCIDPLERRVDQESNPGAFVNNVTGAVAQDFCQQLGSVTNSSGDWTYDLCSETQWVSACQGNAASAELNFGLIENGSASVAEGLLFTECNVGTLDSLGAKSDAFNTRSRKCVTEDGVYDLSGQYQEWVLRTSGYGLKGASWASGEGILNSNISNMARCKATNIPVRVVPSYVDTSTKLLRLNDGTILLETDSLLLDTLISARVRDTLDESYYDDQVILFEISNQGTVLVSEFPVDYNEYRRDSTTFTEVYFNGLEAKIVERVQTVYITGTKTQSAADFHKDESISFRCCATLAP